MQAYSVTGPSWASRCDGLHLLLPLRSGALGTCSGPAQLSICIISSFLANDKP